MGNEGSVANPYPAAFAYVAPDEYAPMHGFRSDMTDDSLATVQPISNCAVVHNPSLLKGWVQSTWSLVNPVGEGPCPRASHFSVYDPTQNRLYIGYGLGIENKSLNDVWAFDFKLNRWAQLPIHGEIITPRSGCRATLLARYIVVFGGYSDKQYLSDFHIINLDTYEVSRPAFQGPIPRPRTAPMVESHDGKIFIWGGYDGNYISELSILDPANKLWTQMPLDVQGRTGFPHVKIDNLVYIHGGSKEEHAPMMVLNLSTGEVHNIEPRGIKVNTRTISASMIQAGPIFLLIGGRSNEKYSYVYAYHIERQHWMIFHIAPDGETVSTQDGNVDENGLFQLPRPVSTSLVYQESERTVYGFLGQPLKNPPPIFMLNVGASIANINLQDDMLKMLNVN